MHGVLYCLKPQARYRFLAHFRLLHPASISIHNASKAARLRIRPMKVWAFGLFSLEIDHCIPKRDVFYEMRHCLA